MMDNPTAIRPGEEVNQASLQTYLADNISNVGVIERIGQFPGGYSNLTYFIKTSEREFVLRRPPFGAKDIKGGHDMGREFRVLTMLRQAGYQRIPEPVLYCDDESVIGSSFYIMVRVPGVILRAPSAASLGVSTDTMRRLSEALVDTLADLHALDIYQTGLIGLGKPEGYIQRQVEGWHKRYVAAQTDDVPAMTDLARYLTDHLPADNPPTLLHNDFKYDNVVLNPDGLSDIRAVLDWEMCTVGDPLMDVGTSLSYWSELHDDDFRKSLNPSWLPGNLTRQEFARRYADRSSRDVSNLLYFYVFGLFKNAVVVQQIYNRYKKGLTSDERFANLLTGVQSLAQAGTKALDNQSF